jgi:hypothetical protein
LEDIKKLTIREYNGVTLYLKNLEKERKKREKKLKMNSKRRKR